MSCPAGTEIQPGTVTYGTVLVPLDGSHIAAEALPHAVDVARRCNARLVLLHVLPAAAEDGASRELQAQRSQTEAYFAGLKRSLRALRRACRLDDRRRAGGGDDRRRCRHLDRPLIVLAQAGRTAALETGDKRRVGNVTEQVERLWDGPLSLIKPVV